MKSIDASPGFLTFTDGFACTLAGLPGIGLLQDSPNYDRDAHSSEDSLETVNAAALRFNTKVLASSGFLLADMDQRPGIVFSQAQTSKHSAQFETLYRCLELVLRANQRAHAKPAKIISPGQ